MLSRRRDCIRAICQGLIHLWLRAFEPRIEPFDEPSKAPSVRSFLTVPGLKRAELLEDCQREPQLALACKLSLSFARRPKLREGQVFNESASASDIFSGRVDSWSRRILGSCKRLVDSVFITSVFESVLFIDSVPEAGCRVTMEVGFVD